MDGWIDPQPALGLRRGPGIKQVEIDARRHHLHPADVGAIQPLQLRQFGGGGGDDGVGIAQQLCLLADAQVALAVARAGGHAVLHEAQGVKHLDEWHAPGRPQAAGGDARQPIVAVDQVVDFVV